MIIHSISGPRNISTSLMYSFAQRRDTTVVDEPFYAAYLRKNTELAHPDREQILNSQSQDAEKVYAWITQSADKSELFYVKDMAHHFSEIQLPPFESSKAIFLVRHPEKLIASFQKVIAKPTLKDIGLKDEWDLYKSFVKQGIPSFVVPTEKLTERPEHGLKILCDKLEIPFTKAMLEWKAGPKYYDGCWAPHWYANTHRSTGFMPFLTQESSLDDHGRALLEESIPFYLHLMKHAIL
ncbi:MAG: hypothetical protein HWD92_09135 [Flavobacteriia bacterium]|nr:hypothetical protein [Flavobacteriia bacterium]